MLEQADQPEKCNPKPCAETHPEDTAPHRIPGITPFDVTGVMSHGCTGFTPASWWVGKPTAKNPHGIRHLLS